MQQNSGLLKDNVQVQNRQGKSTGNLNQVHLEKIGLAYKWRQQQPFHGQTVVASIPSQKLQACVRTKSYCPHGPVQPADSN